MNIYLLSLSTSSCHSSVYLKIRNLLSFPLYSKSCIMKSRTHTFSVDWKIQERLYWWSEFIQIFSNCIWWYFCVMLDIKTKFKWLLYTKRYAKWFTITVQFLKWHWRNSLRGYFICFVLFKVLQSLSGRTLICPDLLFIKPCPLLKNLITIYCHSSYLVMQAKVIYLIISKVYFQINPKIPANANLATIYIAYIISLY